MSIKRTGRLILAGLAIVALPALADTPANPTTTPAERTFTHTLSNGLKIIVREDHRAPVMVSQVWYKVGSSYETPGLTGISHVLEHMMFKGTPMVPAGEFSKIIANYGGSENAFTTNDYTAYYQLMNARDLPLSFELEADRMQHALIPDAEFKKEIEVVKEERRMRTDDNPNALAFERFSAAAYVSSGYHHPTIGWMHDIKRITATDVRNWYHNWYAPNNAILVVVGDVKAPDVFQLAARYFGAIPRRDLPKPQVDLEVKPLGERRLTLDLPAKLPTLYMGYNVPGINTAKDENDVYALRMLAAVLDGGASARIETHLVRGQQIAASAGASYGGFSLGDTLFILSGIPGEGHTLAELEAALKDQIAQLQTDLATPDELERIKAQIVSGIVFQQDSISSQANQIGRLEAIGRSWRDGDQLAAKLEQVTPEQIRAVARKYLVSDRLTVAYLQPKPQPKNGNATDGQ